MRVTKKPHLIVVDTYLGAQIRSSGRVERIYFAKLISHQTAQWTSGGRNENHPLCHDEVFKMNGDVKCRRPPGAGRAGKEKPANGSHSTSVTLKFEPKFFFMELDAGICSKLCKNL